VQYTAVRKIVHSVHDSDVIEGNQVHSVSHNQSEKQSSFPRRQSRGKVPEVYGGKDL